MNNNNLTKLYKICNWWMWWLLLEAWGHYGNKDTGRSPELRLNIGSRAAPYMWQKIHSIRTSPKCTVYSNCNACL